MKIHTDILDINKFKEDFMTLYRGKDKEQALDGIVLLLNESNCSIHSFLRKVDLIEDKKVQKLCRHTAIAQMYNAGLNDYKDRSCYVETAPYGELIMIQLSISTAILSKYGDIIIPEGELWTHAGLNYGGGFIVRKIIDGQVSTKFGFIDNAGVPILPCIFDYIEGHIGSPYIFYFGPSRFHMHRYGNIDSVSRDELQEMIDHYDRKYYFYCISEANILFSLNSLVMHGEPPDDIPDNIKIENNKHSSLKRDELMEELRTALSPILISKEKLQEIMESK